MPVPRIVEKGNINDYSKDITVRLILDLWCQEEGKIPLYR
jgi:hypothetical protein